MRKLTKLFFLCCAILWAGVASSRGQANSKAAAPNDLAGALSAAAAALNAAATALNSAAMANKAAAVATNAPVVIAKAQSSTNLVRKDGFPRILTKTNTWKTSVSLGVTLARGNTDTTLASAAVNTEKKWLQNDLVLGSDALYGETKTPGQSRYTVNAEVLHGFIQYNRELKHHFYAYGRLDGFHDGVAEIKYRLTVAPGMGYYFVTNKIVDLAAEGGPGYVYERFEDRTENFATLRLAERGHYHINPHANAWETVEILPQINQFNNYVLTAELGFETSISRNNRLTLRTVLQDYYNNIPASGRLRNDLKLITSVAYKF